MTSIANSSVKIQTTSESNPSPPGWFGEVVLLISALGKHGVLSKINEKVRFARRRFGHYEVIDFLAVLFGYAISGERTLQEFYKHLQPFAGPFMALFERDRLPSRSALSRFLAALTEEPVEALRGLFLDDLESRPLSHASQEKPTGNLVDRAGTSWVVFDIDARGKLLANALYPRARTCLPPFADWTRSVRLATEGASVGKWCAPAPSSARLTAESRLGSFGNRGNGRYREELRKALGAIGRSLSAYQLPQERTLLHIFGQYGTAAVLADLAGFAFVTRGKDDSVLDHPLVQARLHLPPDQFQQRPQSQVVRSLYDCPAVPIGSEGVCCRVVVATHPADNKKSPMGVTREGVGSAPPQGGLPWKAGRFSRQDFALQPDGTLRGPAEQKLLPPERRREANGSLRVVYGASIRSCRPCPLREQCQWNGKATAKPRQVSVLLHPLQVGPAPLLWRDWSRRVHRRACIQLVRHQRLELSLSPPIVSSSSGEVILSRAQRAHSRLSWQERLARNTRPPTAGSVTIKLFGIPAPFAASLGLTTA